MRVLLIIILGALCAWLFYDRSDLKQQLALAVDKISQTQSELNASKKKAENALAELDKLSPERQSLLTKLQQQQAEQQTALAEANAKQQAAQAEVAAKQAEVERLSKKSWIQQQIESRGDPLARPPVGGPAATVRRTSPLPTPNPSYPYPYSR